MFGSGISQEGGNIPDEILSKIRKFSLVFIELLRKLVEQGTYDRRVVRLIHPVNVAILLDDANVHFIFSLNPGAMQVIQHNDFRTKGAMPINIAVSIIERDLLWKDCFGFSIPSGSLNDEYEDDQLFPHVERYYKNELLLYEKLASIVRINPIFKGRDFLVNNHLVFVLMPFSDEQNLQEIYREYIKPAVEENGFECRRADDIYDNKPIVESIWENINRSKVIIAELTGKNPNVFYELGISHTVGKEIVLLAQDINDVPFDLKHLRVIIYDFTPKGVENLKQQLMSTLQFISDK